MILNEIENILFNFIFFNTAGTAEINASRENNNSWLAERGSYRVFSLIVVHIIMSPNIANLKTNSPDHRIPVQSYSPDQPNSLNKIFSDLRNRAGALESKRILDKNKLNKLRINIITQIFVAMKEIGVDPGNLESVSGFLQQLERQDPDLLALFESAMSGFMDQPDNNASDNALSASGGGLSGRFSNLQKAMMRK